VCVGLSGQAMGQEGGKQFKAHTVKTPDGLTIAVQQWGQPDGPEILFIHAFSQSHLSWIKQVDSELGKTFWMVTYDIRGHGTSDKPLEPERYRDAKLWADEVKAVMDSVGLRRPVLVGSSYAGRIIGDYLRQHGQGRLAGINFVGAVTKSDPRFFGETLRRDFPRMMSEDLATNIAGTRDFVRTLTAKPMSSDEFEVALAFNMIVPPKVRAGLGGREAKYEDVLSALKIPVLVTHGIEDRLVLVAAARYTASVVLNARLSLYEGMGHFPFFEDPARFNKELAEFVKAGASR